MALFGKRAKEQEPDHQRQEAIEWAFDLLELREGRAKHFDKERQEWRAKRRIGDGPHLTWLDEGPLDFDDYNRRFRQWLNDAPNNPVFDVQVYAAEKMRGHPLPQMAEQFDRMAQEASEPR